LMATGNPLRCSAVSIQSGAHHDVGGFNPALRYVVDWDFWLRVARRWALAWLATPTVDVRWHEASETHRFKTGTLDLEETERLLADLFDWLRGQTSPIRPLQTAGYRRLARAYLNRAHVAVHNGDGWLGRRCLRRSIELWPGILR